MYYGCSQFFLHFLTPEQTTPCWLLLRFYRDLRSGFKLLDLNYSWRRKLVFPIWPSNKMSIVLVSQSGCSKTLESAPTKIQSESHVDCILQCKRVNSSRVCVSKWNRKCCLLSWGPKTSQVPSSVGTAWVQGAWIVKSVMTMHPRIRRTLWNIISLKIRSQGSTTRSLFTWFGHI